MLKDLWDRLKRRQARNPNDILMRPASAGDADFFLKLYNDAVRERHFARWQTPHHPHHFAHAVKESLIPNGRWPLLTDPANPRNNKILRAHLFIGEARGKPIGFVAISEPAPGRYEREVELWMIIVAPEHRGRGAGRSMLDLVLNTLTEEKPDRKIVARCFPASQPMFFMLQRRGFRLVNRTADGVRHLERTPDE